MNTPEETNPICEDCGLQYPPSYMNAELCEDCAYEHGEPTQPWQPDPREDGGYFGWAGLHEA